MEQNVNTFLSTIQNIKEYWDVLREFSPSLNPESIISNEKFLQKTIKDQIKLDEFIIGTQLKTHMVAYPLVVSKIFSLVCKRIELYAEQNKNPEQIEAKLKEFEFTGQSNENKKLFSQIYPLVLEFIKDNEWIQLYINENSDSIKDNEIVNFKLAGANNLAKPDEFVFRINQIEAIKRLEANGLETGIHCQATGCGKTFIILKYFDYFVKNKIKGNIILFTERINILADLFGFQQAKGTYDVSKVDEENKKLWKKLGIIDLDKFKVINRVTQSGLDWDESMGKVGSKPKILVINRSYLTRPSMYKKLDKKSIGLVIHDECHSSTSRLCYDFIAYCVSKSIPLVGFSATPLRSGKIKVSESMESNIQRLLNIYGIVDKETKTKKLNLLTNYNMIYAIEHNLILPPEFYWYQFELTSEEKAEVNANPTKTFRGKTFNDEDWAVVTQVLSGVIGKLPNRKIIAWCGGIDVANFWKEKFETMSKDKTWVRTYPFLAQLSYYVDHSKNSTDYPKFKKAQGNCIMFCANKHREGSDIQKLDCCIFLDKVINRTHIPFIQSIGRILRIDLSCPGKKAGIIIDGLAKNVDNYERQLVDKIIGYYLALNNLSSLVDSEQTFTSYCKLVDKVEFDVDNKVIKIGFANQQIVINCNKIDWKNIHEKFKPILGETVMIISPDEALQQEFTMLKARIRKRNFSDKEQYYVYAIDNKLPLEPPVNFSGCWAGWYDFLGTDTTVYPASKREWKLLCEKHLIGKASTYRKKWNTYGLPAMPEELYRDFGQLDIEFSNKPIQNFKKIDL